MINNNAPPRHLTQNKSYAVKKSDRKYSKAFVYIDIKAPYFDLFSENSAKYIAYSSNVGITVRFTIKNRHRQRM